MQSLLKECGVKVMRSLLLIILSQQSVVSILCFLDMLSMILNNSFRFSLMVFMKIWIELKRSRMFSQLKVIIGLINKWLCKVGFLTLREINQLLLIWWQGSTNQKLHAQLARGSLLLLTPSSLSHFLFLKT